MSVSADITVTNHAGARAISPRALRVPQLYLILEGERPSASSMRISLADVTRLTVGRSQERAVTRSHSEGAALRLGVPDRRISSNHAVFRRNADGWALDDAGSKNGSRVNGEACARALLREGDVIELGQTVFLFRTGIIVPGVDPEVADAPCAPLAEGLRTLVPTLARDLDQIARIAPSDVSVLVLGATGTGKEVVARSVHAASRRKGAFVAVNCGAMPSNLVESELFGSKKGAFSGAIDDRLGLVRAANGGTLFLDEIGDLPLAAQAVLLRTLQEREVLPVGGTRAVSVDLRVVAATHHDLEGMLASGRFRSDLFARLAGFTVRLPPLRERIEDVGVLVATLLERRDHKTRNEVTFAPEVVRAFVRYDFPLNIRELEKALTSAIVLADDGRIELEHLPEQFRTPTRSERAPLDCNAGDSPKRPDAPVKRSAITREDIVRELEAHRGNISSVARSMGKARMQIQRWIRRFGVNPDEFRG
jgi:DNA-binding NtrC family response regulator